MQGLRPTGASKLRQMLADSSQLMVAPGVYDGFTARLALSQNFDCLYMTGAGTSLSRLGMADLGLATQTDMVAVASMICSLSPSTPVIADADTGYGGPVQVARTVREYARAGVAALHLEDQVQSKRCGHLLGKQIVSREEFYSRIRAAKMARDACGSDMIIIARTDARAGEMVGSASEIDRVHGADDQAERKFHEAIERLKGARDAGADVLFLEALKTKEEAQRACEILAPTPVLLNMVPQGITPNMTVDEAKECGFRIMIFPTACIEGVMSGVGQELQGLKKSGGMLGENKGIRTAFELCGLHEAINLDEAAGGKAYGSI